MHEVIIFMVAIPLEQTQVHAANVLTAVCAVKLPSTSISWQIHSLKFFQNSSDIDRNWESFCWMSFCLINCIWVSYRFAKCRVPALFSVSVLTVYGLENQIKNDCCVLDCHNNDLASLTLLLHWIDMICYWYRTESSWEFNVIRSIKLNFSRENS